MTQLNIKLTSPDGSWQAAKDLIKAIDHDAKELGVDPSIELDGIWTEKSGKKNTVIQNNGNNSPHSVFFNQQRGDDLA